VKAEDMMDSDELSNRITTEVQRVSEKFRFLMQYKEQFQSSGIEFSDLREYQPTDDASRIDWKNSAKSTKTFVQEYEEEKDMETFIIVDVSDTMLFGTAEKLKSEYAATIAATLAYSAIDSGINVGIALIGDNVTILTPDGGQVQFQKIVHELTDFENYGGDFNMDTAMNKTIGNIKDDTAVFIVSDFLDIKGEWKLKMQLANMKFRHVMSVITKDRRDYKLPDSGLMRFESPDGSQQRIVDTAKIKDDFEEEAEKRKEEIKQKLSESGSAHLEVDTRESFAANFVEYFESSKGSW